MDQRVKAAIDVVASAEQKVARVASALVQESGGVREDIDPEGWRDLIDAVNGWGEATRAFLASLSSKNERPMESMIAMGLDIARSVK